MIPFLDLKNINLQYKEEFHAALDRVLQSGWFVMGPELTSFEKEFKKLKNSKEQLITKVLLKNNYVKFCTYNEDEKPPIWEMRDYTHEELDEFSYEELQSMFYYCKLTKDKLCDVIKDWFEKQDPPLMKYE